MMGTWWNENCKIVNDISCSILSSQVVSLPLQSVMVANFCAAMDTLIDQDVAVENVLHSTQRR